jgi:hypothetical protein
MSITAARINRMADEDAPKWRGLRTIGADLQVSNVSFRLGDDGNLDAEPLKFKLRTDMWPFWVEDAIDAADIAWQMSHRIPPVFARLDDAEEQKDQLQAEIDRLMILELRATMRAITASAFAIDAFYAMVKARCGPHPHDAIWRKNGTSRKKRITETLRYHLRIKTANGTKALKSCVAQVFQFRDWAVHMASEFRDPAPREDILASVDWHFYVFRYQNAVNAVQFTVMILDHLVSILDRGGEELAKCQPLARERMNAIFCAYDEVEALPKLERSEKEADEADGPLGGPVAG